MRHHLSFSTDRPRDPSARSRWESAPDFDPAPGPDEAPRWVAVAVAVLPVVLAGLLVWCLPAGPRTPTPPPAAPLSAGR